MKKIFLLFSGITLAVWGLAQDLHFSQYYNSPMQFNPGMAGTGDGEWRASLNHKSQWLGLAKYNTSAAAFDKAVLKKSAGHLGLAAAFYNDRAGDGGFGGTAFNVTASGILPLSETQILSLGIQAGLVQHSTNLSKLTWGNQFDGSGFNAGAPEGGKIGFFYPDLAAGLFYKYADKNANTVVSGDRTMFDAGLTIFHPHQPNFSYYSRSAKLSMRIGAHASFLKEIESIKMAFWPSAAYYMQGPHREINAGLLVRYRMHAGTKFTGAFSHTAVLFGCNYRVKDAIIPQLGATIGNISVMASYDIPTGKLISSGMMKGFEISIIYSKLDGMLRKS